MSSEHPAALISDPKYDGEGLLEQNPKRIEVYAMDMEKLNKWEQSSSPYPFSPEIMAYIVSHRCATANRAYDQTYSL